MSILVEAEVQYNYNDSLEFQAVATSANLVDSIIKEYREFKDFYISKNDITIKEVNNRLNTRYDNDDYYKEAKSYLAEYRQENSSYNDKYVIEQKIKSVESTEDRDYRFELELCSAKAVINNEGYLMAREKTLLYRELQKSYKTYSEIGEKDLEEEAKQLTLVK